MRLCDDQCPEIALFIEQCNLKDIVSQSVNLSTNDLFLATIQQFNCSDPLSYLIPGVPVDNTTCLSIVELLC